MIDAQTWQTAQNIAVARRASRQKPTQHPHYLKGSVFCAECGSRLGIEHVRAHQGPVYRYLYCLGRRKEQSSCTQRAVQVSRVEQLVEEHWRTVSLSPTVRDDLRGRGPT